MDARVGTGDRVHAHWVDEPAGAITDIAYFLPGDDAEAVDDRRAGAERLGDKHGADDRDPVTLLVVPTSISIQHTASRPGNIYLRALQQGTLLGARSGDTGKVYFPPREADPATGRNSISSSRLPDTGTVTTFAIINIPSPGRRSNRPTSRPTSCWTARTSVPASDPDVDAADVRMGMRVKAVWKPEDEWVSVSTTSSTSGRPANPTPTTTPASITSEGALT